MLIKLFHSNIFARFILRYLSLTLIVTGLSSLTIKPLSAAEVPELERIVMQLKWSHQFQFAGYYAAKEQGFYLEEGLDVVFNELDLVKGYISPVLSGEASYGVGDNGLLLHRAQGKPVVLLKQIFQDSPLVLITRRDSGITNPYQLRDKRIMVGGGIRDSELRIMLEETVGNVEQLDLVEPSFGFTEFINGEIDALAAYSTAQPYLLEKLGIEINLLEPSNFGIDFYGDNLFTTESEVSENPDRVEAMIRASIKGWQYALAHPAEIISLIRKKYNPVLTEDELVYEAEQTARMIRADEVPLGSIVPSRITNIALTYQRMGLTNDARLGKFIYQHPEHHFRDERKFYKKLSRDEQHWLAQHPVVRVGVVSDFAPHIFIADDEVKGFSIDYLKLLSQRLGIKVEYVRGTFPELLHKAKLGLVDVLPAMLAFPHERTEFLKFTQSYKDSLLVVVTSSNGIPVNDLDDLAGRRIALIRESASKAVAEKMLPASHIVLVDSYETSLKMVAFGKVDATISELSAVNLLKRDFLLNNLNVAMEVDAPQDIDLQVRLAVRKDWPAFVALLNKAMNSLSSEAFTVLDDRWLSMENRNITSKTAPELPTKQLLLSNSLSFLVGSFSLIIIGMLLLFHWLNRSVKSTRATHFSSPKVNRYLLVIINALLIVIAMVLTWWALENIKSKVKQNMQSSLLAVLNTSQQALKLWSSEQNRQLKSLATQADVLTLTKRQLQKYQQGDELKKSSELIALRAFFRDVRVRGDRLGFFIVAPDGTNIFSMRDANLGDINLIKTQRPDLFRRVLAGEAVMVPPIPSDVPLVGIPHIAGSKLPATMFFMHPVIGEQGAVIAVLTERFHPNETFSRLNQLSRIGESGETYSFNRQGEMLSDSRFYADLVTTGLLKPDQQSILSLHLRDPGVDLVAGLKTNIPRHQQPLTRMAKSATEGVSGIDVVGYRDYRGVPVMGAWLWDESLSLGMAVEIDLDEAMDAYYSARTVVFVTLGVTVLISIISSLLLMLSASRVNRALLVAKVELEKRVEQRTEELQLSEARLKLVLDNVPGPVFFKDHQGRYQMVNSQFEQVTGISLENALGKKDNQLFESEVAKQISERDNQVMVSGSTNQYEEKIPDANGNMRDYLTTKVATFSLEKSGQVGVGLVGVALDITERKQAELKLQQVLLNLNEQRFVLDQHAIVGVTDLQGVITYANEKFADISGYSADELIGENHRMLNSGIHNREFWQDMYQTVKTGNVWQGEVCNQTKDGDVYWVDTTIAAFKGEDGKPTAYIAIRTDISERKRYESKMLRAIEHAEAANIAKSEFVASMSHEIRTPMNGVLGMLDLLSTSGLSVEQQHRLDIAQNSGQALLTLINDILDFSKVEAGKLDLEALDFNVCDLLEDIVQTMVYRSDEKGLELNLNVSHIDDCMVNGDPSRLRQIVLNLLSNAIKFTEFGKIDINAKLTQQGETHIQLLCEVIDTGVGISGEAIAGLFDSFTQADASTTRKYGGSGLGLAICKKLCQLMQGDIQVTSEQGKGSCFTFTLLLDHSNSTEKHAQSVGSSSAHPAKTELPEWPTGTRILLAEDNQVNQVVLKGMLKRIGLTCDVAGSGLEAIASLRKSPSDAPYTLIFMDCQMPDLDGYQATSRIRSGLAGERYLTVPIVAMTANAMQGDKEKCLEVGMNDYLPKPLKPEYLLSSLIKWLFVTQNQQFCEGNTKTSSELVELPCDKTMPLFSSQLVLEACDNDLEMAIELLEVFLQYAPINRDNLRQAYHFGDKREIKKLAHKISGSIAYLAVSNLCEQAETIELLASSTNTIIEDKLMDDFIHGLTVLHAEAKRWLQSCFDESQVST